MTDHPNVRRILTINTGSASLKVVLYEVGTDVTRLLAGQIDEIGLPGGHFQLKDAHGVQLMDQRDQFPDHVCALNGMLAWLRMERPNLKIDAVGHRVVHGGTQYREPQRVTPELIIALKALVSIAPNHLPQAIETIEATACAFPEVPQAACFDTSFHRSMPRVAQMYPLPRDLYDAGIIRYGFHGLSYESIMQQLRVCAPLESQGRVVIAHLGIGASMAAVRDGVSIDTTMGFTPTGGLMMGTRSGDLDPGVLIHLLVARKLTPAAVNELVNRQAGLLGVSGSSSDMQDLLERESSDLRAADAVAMFCYQAKKYLGAMAAALGGLDALVFTGGIGESDSQVRLRICEGLGFLGIELDESCNASHAAVISSTASRATVRVIQADEDLMIATSVCRMLAFGSIKKEV